MFRSVLVGFDASDQGRDALALALALTAADGELVVCCVYPPDPPLIDPIPPQLGTEGQALQRIDAAREQLGDEQRARYVTRLDRSPAEGLHAEVAARGSELLVVGSSHRGTIGRILPGSVTRQALQAAPCAVAVAPRGLHDRTARPPRRIGVAYDGGEQAARALHVAAGLVREADAELIVLAVVDVVSEMGGWAAAWSYGDVLEAERAAARAWVDDAVAAVPGLRASGRVLEGGAAEQLAGASTELDLLVLGSRNYGPVRRALLGSVSGRVAEHAHCPVVVIPRASTNAAADAA